jgi:hypothetical protein
VRVRVRVRVSGEGEGEGEVRVGLVQLSRHTDTCMVHLGSWLRGSGALAVWWLLQWVGSGSRLRPLR